MNLIFIAPPSAGKGTISFKLVENNGYQHLSTGDLLREEIKSGTDLGNDIKHLMDDGELVSDSIINELVKHKLESLHGSKFILDGFPRNVEQAAVLNDIFTSLNIDNYIVIYLGVDFDTLLDRVTGRKVCLNCKKIYNIHSDEFKPKVDNVCDDCGTELITRDDDTVETFTKRYNTYLKSTEPVLEYYKNKDKLVIIEVEKSSHEAYEKVLEILGEM